MRLSGQYSSLNSDLTDELGWPGRFVRLEAQPQIEIKGIPLKGQVFLTAQPGGLNYEYQTVGLQLDPHTLISNLQEEAVRRVEQAEYLRQAGQPFDREVLQKADQLKAEALQSLQDRYGSKLHS